MEGDFFIEASGRPGLRLHKLEFYNWGTFDSSDGSVHTVRPEGRTALLVGRNGSGKSTLTDALITLLVRPGVRNYNVAAGATQRRERNERTYVRGAYDHGSVEGEGSRSATRYLRDGKRGLYSVVLGVFRNEDGDKVFTVAQVLYLTSDDRVDKVYAFSEEEKSIADDLSGFTSFERFRVQVQDRGFEAATSFTQYEKWLKRAGGFRDKAMDVFNQTVAVKDIQSLNGFIRTHMLEKRDWKDQVTRILNHFSQLSEAHRSLKEAREQMELLLPIRKTGQEWLEASEAKRDLDLVKSASGAWFRQRSIDLFTPLLEREKESLARAERERDGLDSSLEKSREEERNIRNEMDEQGGERLKLLPQLIQSREEAAGRKRSAADRFGGWLSGADLGGVPAERGEFETLRNRLTERQSEIADSLGKLETRQTGFTIQLHGLNQQIEELTVEIEALSQRKTNLPENLVEVRRRLCETLHLAEADLPFAAELMAVRAAHREWEASIEMVLRSFGLSLLVPEGQYRNVSELVNRTRLVDGKGHGQRLVYRKIGHRVFDESDGMQGNDLSRLPARLVFREGRPLVPWLRQEIANRFNYRCCETIEDFQEAHGQAMTIERHVKSGGDRHEKDDRRSAVDPSRFVLGWDNKEKLRLLRERLVEESGKREEVERERTALKSAIRKLQDQDAAIRRALEVNDFDEIDFRSEDAEVAALREEKRALETGSETMRILRERLDATLEEIHSLNARRDALVAKVDELGKRIEFGERLVRKSEEELARLKESDRWEGLEQNFPRVTERFGDREFTPETCATVERDFKDELDSEIRAASEEIEPLERRLHERMARFLTRFSSFQNEMKGTSEYTGSFLDLLERIEREDLPRHEQRFKERLNEKVTQEIGFLNGELLTEARQIRSSIDLLNDALRNLEYREGTHMQLEPREVRDREITAFKRQLHDCLSDSFEGTLAADEQRFKRIEKLIVELRDEERWREKVTDVRRWYDFYANEIVTETGEERSSYSDSAGRSGGEKAKLAFTILVAAIAYQYQIDPHRETSDKFHFVVVDEMFSKVDDDHAEYALRLFQKFGLQLLIVAPLDAKARITEGYVDFYLLATKDEKSSHSRVYSMTAGEYRELALAEES